MPVNQVTIPQIGTANYAPGTDGTPGAYQTGSTLVPNPGKADGKLGTGSNALFIPSSSPVPNPRAADGQAGTGSNARFIPSSDPVPNPTKADGQAGTGSNANFVPSVSNTRITYVPNPNAADGQDGTPGSTPVVPPALPAVTLNLDTVNTINGHAILQWSAAPGGADLYEVWRQFSGLDATSGVVVSSPFAFLATTGNNTPTYVDNLTLSADSASGIADYKVRYKKNGVFSDFSTPIGWLFAYDFTLTGSISTLSLPNLQIVTGSLKITAPVTLTTYSLPRLKTVGNDGGAGDLGVAGNGITSVDFSSLVTLQSGSGTGIIFTTPALVSLTFPSLVSCGGATSIQIISGVQTFSCPVLSGTDGDIDFNSNTTVVSISLPAYLSCGELLNLNSCSALTTFSAPLLFEIIDQIQFNNCGALVTLSLPGLTSITNIGINPFAPANCTHLTTTSFPVLVYLDGLTYDLAGCALSAASVNAILRRAVISNPTGAIFNLDGGTNAAPTGQGLTDKATLIGNGNTVNTN